MAEVLQTQSHINMDFGRRQNATPPSLPSFVFPMSVNASDETHPPIRSDSSPRTAFSSPSAHRHRPRPISTNALPAFDFSPAQVSPKDPSSPPRSPLRRTPPAYSAHKRNGSEFVGGDIKHGGPMLVSTSPTRSEESTKHHREGSDFFSADAPLDDHTNVQLPESFSSDLQDLHLGPPAPRRSHAHKRSGAISSHDLSHILRPSTESRSGSAPTTPSDLTFQCITSSNRSTSPSQPLVPSDGSDSSIPLPKDEEQGVEGETKSRVRISDVLEYIPRPLSTISSETSSSMSTVRANHSVTNSISSIVSAGTSSPSPGNILAARRFSGFNSSQAKLEASFSPHSSRSSSAEFEPPSRRPSSAPTPTQHSSALVDPAQAAKASLYSSPQNVKSTLNLSSEVAPEEMSSLSLKRRMTPSNSSPLIRPRTSPEPKVTKRQRKGRSWAGLLSRKAKLEEPNTKQARRTPTPPIRKSFPETEISLDDISLDDADDCVIESAPSLFKPGRVQQIHAMTPRSTAEIENPPTILDIDLALNSSDTQSIDPLFEEVVASNSAGSKRRLHSSGATGGFSGPGMHYHRRAESAPELDTVDRSRFGFPRLASNPAMAIEEEEEENDEDGSEKFQSTNYKDGRLKTYSDEKGTSGLGVNIVEANEDEAIRRRKRRGTKDEAETPKACTPTKECSPVEIVSADEEPRFSVVTKSSDESTIIATPSHAPAVAQPDSFPFEFAMSTPALTYGASETTSAVSSPDFGKTSFEGSRLHTASSSITDRVTLNSSRAGDHTLCSHSSVDDVPSLTSSASIMSTRPPRISSSGTSGYSAERSSSLSAATPARARPASAHKRLSLASFSKFTGSSHNRSKLNLEVVPMPDVEEPVEKKKKANRLSRMIKFLKFKGKVSP